MAYPETIPAVKEALVQLAYDPASALPDEAKEKLVRAASHASPVEAFHAAIDALAPLEDVLSDDGNSVLAGATRLCTENGWGDRNGHDYAALFVSSSSALPLPPESHQSDSNEDP